MKPKISKLFLLLLLIVFPILFLIYFNQNDEKFSLKNGLIKYDFTRYLDESLEEQAVVVFYIKSYGRIFRYDIAGEIRQLKNNEGTFLFDPDRKIYLNVSTQQNNMMDRITASKYIHIDRFDEIKNQQFLGRKCKVYDYSDSGYFFTALTWKGIIVQSEEIKNGEKEIISAISIDENPINDSLFEIPKGFKEADIFEFNNIENIDFEQAAKNTTK